MDAALGIVVRWALVADLMLLFGMPLFAIYSVDGAAGKAMRAVLIATALSGLLLSILGIMILTASMSGVALTEVDTATIVMLVSGTAVGMAFVVRMVALAMALALAMQLRQRRAVTVTIVLCAAIALGSLAWSGHGVMDDGRTGTVHLVTDIVHLLAAGVWVGALAALLRLLTAAQDDSGAAPHRALAGFATVGTASVAIVLASGLINSWLLVGPRNIMSLGTSLYGQLLLIKLALFAGMVSLAAINRFRLTPALEGAQTADDARNVRQRLRLSLTLETVVAFAILGLVAWLGTLEPPVSTP